MRYQVFKDSVLVKIVKGSKDKLLFKLLELEKENPNCKIRFTKCL